MNCAGFDMSDLTREIQCAACLVCVSWVAQSRCAALEHVDTLLQTVPWKALLAPLFPEQSKNDAFTKRYPKSKHV